MFLNYWKPNALKGILGFRPLSGSYVSQYGKEMVTGCVVGFRPLSGSYVSQFSEKKDDSDQKKGFRPLSGSYVSQYTSSYFCNAVWKFPSPVGELCFSINTQRLYLSKQSVSVPCRGAMFLNNKSPRGYLSGAYCFRPLSGSYVSQLFHALDN